ncbi:ATP-binding protein [Petroclostridium sp. X23]|uniref:ATP-binding protein n=1 Tax=Petroclostridium sp. X23 TaxID=3045146 RepID=UPI0024AC918D|nr:ATP-binding protein [Petroclostridium sp. X23]WHH58839.1 ATP-binding protein [Petroclostridium sp. X23]
MFTPKIKDISLFKEIAKNVVNPLEVIREGISNSHDAEAKQISITVYRNSEGKFILEMQDDGRGMDFNAIHRFFNLGDSLKNSIGIGKKGLGTKTYFKSDKLTLQTQNKDDEAFKAVMEKPWDTLLSDKIPQYVVENVPPKPGRRGSTVTIEGYFMDNPEKYFNFDTIKDYILWFTAAGSFKTYFANYPELHKYIQNMQVAPRVFLEDKILKLKEEIAGTHQFSPPQEKPNEDPEEEQYKRSVNYCRHFGPYHRATNINGEYVSLQLYGTVSGLNCRKSLCKLKRGESIKSRFGLYLAKDFIPIIKRMNLINEYNSHHYHLLLNSQAFELTADRNNISNEDDPKVKWVLDEAKKIIDYHIKPLAEEGYFKFRKNEEIEYVLKNKQQNIKRRIEYFEGLENLMLNELSIIKRPDCESQAAILFTALLSNDRTKPLIKYIEKIGHYSHQSPTDMICIDKEGNKILVEIEYRLSSLFRHDHPYNTFDYVICWSVDLEINEKKRLQDGTILNLIQESGEWILKYGAQKVIPIIELKSVIHQLDSTKIYGVEVK